MSMPVRVALSRAACLAAVLAPIGCARGAETEARPAAGTASPAEGAAPAPTASSAAEPAPRALAVVVSASAVAPRPVASAVVAAGGASAARATAPLDFPAAPRDGILPPGAADAILPSGQAPSVRLVEAGAEPRAALAYSLVKGRAVALGMALDMTMGVKSAGRSVEPSAIPRLSLLLDLTTGDAEPGGDPRVDAKLGKVTVEPRGASQAAMADLLRPAMERLGGLSMSYRVSPSGHVHDLVVQPPAGAPQGSAEVLGGVSQSFESMVAPLPAEPVGVGARWRVVSRVSAAGPDLLQLATYTLTALSGREATLGLVLTQVAASDEVRTPGLPDGVKARLRSFRSSGRGASRIDLGSVAPEAGTLTVDSAMDLEVAQGDGPGQRTSAESTMRVEFSRPSR
jgi:hypothetical protein